MRKPDVHPDRPPCRLWPGTLGWLPHLTVLAVPAVAAGLPAVSRLVPEPSTWHITRAAGIMAYLFLWLAAATGLLLSSRLLGRAAPPPLLGAAHQWGAAWSLYATVVHAVILRYDHWVPFRWPDILLPFAATYRTGAVALGVYALYALVGVQVTSYLRARLGAATWRLAHALAVPAYVLALIHGVWIGTDTVQPWVQALYWSTGSVFAFLLLARLLLAGGARAGGGVPGGRHGEGTAPGAR